MVTEVSKTFYVYYFIMILGYTHLGQSKTEQIDGKRLFVPPRG
jgi:hypothetical protein